MGLTDEEQAAAMQRLKGLVQGMINENSEAPISHSYRSIERMVQLVRDDTHCTDAGRAADTRGDMRRANALLKRVARGHRARRALAPHYTIANLTAKLKLVRRYVDDIHGGQQRSPRRARVQHVVDLHIPPAVSDESVTSAREAGAQRVQMQAANFLKRVARGMVKREQLRDASAMQALRDEVAELRNVCIADVPESAGTPQDGGAVFRYVVQQAKKISVLQAQLEAAREFSRGNRMPPPAQAAQQQAQAQPQPAYMLSIEPARPDSISRSATHTMATAHPGNVVYRTSSSGVARGGSGRASPPLAPAERMGSPVSRSATSARGYTVVARPAPQTVPILALAHAQGRQRTRSPTREATYTGRAARMTTPATSDRSTTHVHHVYKRPATVTYCPPAAPPRLPENPLISQLHATGHGGGRSSPRRAASPNRVELRTTSPPSRPRRAYPDVRVAKTPVSMRGNTRARIASNLKA